MNSSLFSVASTVDEANVHYCDQHFVVLSEMANYSPKKINILFVREVNPIVLPPDCSTHTMLAIIKYVHGLTKSVFRLTFTDSRNRLSNIPVGTLDTSELRLSGIHHGLSDKLFHLHSDENYFDKCDPVHIRMVLRKMWMTNKVVFSDLFPSDVLFRMFGGNLEITFSAKTSVCKPTDKLRAFSIAEFLKNVYPVKRTDIPAMIQLVRCLPFSSASAAEVFLVEFLRCLCGTKKSNKFKVNIPKNQQQSILDAVLRFLASRPGAHDNYFGWFPDQRLFTDINLIVGIAKSHWKTTRKTCEKLFEDDSIKTEDEFNVEIEIEFIEETEPVVKRKRQEEEEEDSKRTKMLANIENATKVCMENMDKFQSDALTCAYWTEKFDWLNHTRDEWLK